MPEPLCRHWETVSSHPHTPPLFPSTNYSPVLLFSLFLSVVKFSALDGPDDAKDHSHCLNDLACDFTTHKLDSLFASITMSVLVL